jgi:hypothetical protein
LFIEPEEFRNVDCFLLIVYVPERIFHSSDDKILVRIIERYVEKILQLFFSLELGIFVVPLEMYPFSEKYLTGNLSSLG